MHEETHSQTSRPAVRPIDIAEARRGSAQGPAAVQTRLPLRRETPPTLTLIDGEEATPVCREQYRRLAASLHQLHTEGLSIVMIASALPREGKTTVAANLALTFARSYDRTVLLVDADLRQPRLHQVFGVDNSNGLSGFLTGQGDATPPIHEIAPGLSLVPGGAPTAEPMACLTSARMKRVLAKAPESFNWVIVDTPAMAALPDAGLLASLVDGVVMVVNARSTPYDPVKRAIEAIGKGRIVGVVLNRVERAVLNSHGGKYYPGEGSRP